MTTNQAFIKAYRQDPAEPAPTRPASVAAGRPPIAALGTSVEYVAAGVGQSAAAHDTHVPVPHKPAHTATPVPHRQAPTATPRPLREAHTAVPVPSREGQAEGSTIWPTCDAPFGRVDPPARQVAGGKRPLSAFTSQRRVAPPQPPVTTPATATGFEPATTIASFSWPSVCRALCRECGSELDRIADRLVRDAEQGRSLIGLIGLFPQSGTTTTVLCVATRLAARRHRVIVVEGNFLAPRLAGWLDATPTVWWQDVLERSVPTADAVIHALEDNLDLLPLDTETASPLRLAGSLQASATAGALRNAYDLALVDLGPFFDPDSQPIAMELVRSMGIDAALAVAGPQPADPRDLATLAEYLGQSECDLLGTIENRVAKPQAIG